MQTDATRDSSTSFRLELVGKLFLEVLPSAKASPSHSIGSTITSSSSVTLLHHPLIQLAVTSADGLTTLYRVQPKLGDTPQDTLAVELVPTLVTSIKHLVGSGPRSGSVPTGLWVSGGGRQGTVRESVHVAPDVRMQGAHVALSDCANFLATASSATGAVDYPLITGHSHPVAN